MSIFIGYVGGNNWMFGIAGGDMGISIFFWRWAWHFGRRV